MMPCQGGREDLVNLVLIIEIETWIRYDAMNVINLGTTINIVPNLISTRGKMKNPMSSEKWKNQIQIKRRNKN